MIEDVDPKNVSISPEAISPLDEIRQEEMNAASQVLHARQAADQARQAASEQAARLKARAARDGARDGQARREEMVREAALEADEIITQARETAEAAAAQGRERNHSPVEWAVRIVLGLEDQEGEL